MKIQVSPLKKREIGKASNIVGKNYSRQYQRLATPELKEMFGKSNNKPTYFVAKDKEKILGFAGYIQSWMDYDAYEIFWVNVLPEHQKQGIGKMLVTKIIADIKKRKKDGLIILSASIPNSKYYADYFKFKTVALFGKKKQHLMTLAI
ncbi:MAG: GNAT family N-acetyltransferase [Patescibacteria group bacterium]